MYYHPNPLETYPPFASTVLISMTKEEGKYYVSFTINGVSVSLGSACKESVKCELSDVLRDFKLNFKVI